MNKIIEFTDKKFMEIRNSGIKYHISYHPITFIPSIVIDE